MTVTKPSGSSVPDWTLGPLCPFFDVSAVSGSTVGADEAWDPGADWGESGLGVDCGAAGVDAVVEQLATASAHVPTPAMKTAGFFTEALPFDRGRYQATPRRVAASTIPQRPPYIQRSCAGPTSSNLLTQMLPNFYRKPHTTSTTLQGSRQLCTQISKHSLKLSS